MTKYCRYCDHMLCGRNQKFGLCRKKHEYKERDGLKHTNNCKDFQFNPVDALRENVKGYRPTGRKIEQYGGLGKQVTLEEIINV